jgi:molecular chaperone DnaK
MEDGIPVIMKSNLMKDSMPLCVSVNKRQEILVGDIAWNAYKADKSRNNKSFGSNSNSFVEFTRTLGTNHTYQSTNAGRGFTSEELLAECFKQLKSFISDEIINSVVISVPSKFHNLQNEAVIRAGKLAGFNQIELVQESIAASFGFGLKIGMNIFFDFGKSELKVSLIKNNNICDSEVDNWIGSKNIIEAIVDEIIIPYLKENFAIEFILNDSYKKGILRNAVKFYAEVAMERLNNNDSHNVLSDVGDLPFEDENGDELEFDIELTQQDLAWVSRPIYQKAIDITVELLKRNNLKGKDVDHICLVGADTYSPILRKMLKEQINDNVNTSLDPMTVVAKGAALYSSTISVSDEVKEITRNKAKIQLDIKYEATTVKLDEMVILKVLKEKTIGTLPNKIYAEIVHFNGAWSSGKKLIGEKKTIVDVLLFEQPINIYKVITYNEFGNQIECEPNEITFSTGFPSHIISLSYHIGISKYFESEGKKLFTTIKGLEKNKQLPAIGVIKGFKTTIDIRPGMISDVIRIPIYQGDYNAEGTNPLLNNHILDIVISGETLPALLPAGSDIDFTIKVDTSQLITSSAYIPYFNHTDELVIEMKEAELPTVEFLFKEISAAKRKAKSLNAINISEKLELLEKQLEIDKLSSDVKLKIFDGLCKELLELDSAEKTAEWPKVEQELKDAFYEMEMSSSNETRISEFSFTIEQILKEKNIREAKLMLVEINDFNSSATISDKYIDNLKGELVLFYADNPAMGKERFRFLLGELIRIEKNEVGEDDKIKVVDTVKKELLKWK